LPWLTSNRNPPTSTSQIAGLQMHTTMPSLLCWERISLTFCPSWTLPSPSYFFLQNSWDYMHEPLHSHSGFIRCVTMYLRLCFETPKNQISFLGILLESPIQVGLLHKLLLLKFLFFFSYCHPTLLEYNFLL
jgi:hypothetical protein